MDLHALVMYDIATQYGYVCASNNSPSVYFTTVYLFTKDYYTSTNPQGWVHVGLLFLNKQTV